MSVKLAEYPKAYRETVALFEAFRRLNFSADQIYFQVGVGDPGGACSIHLVLLVGEEKFTAVTGIVFEDPDVIEKRWKELAQAVADRTIPEDELKANWAASMVRRNSTNLVLRLSEAGFLDWAHMPEEEWS